MGIIKDYKAKDMMSPGLASLYTSRTIILIAAGFVGLFLPVFLLQQFGSLEKTIWFYLVGWIMYMLMVVPGAKLMNILGTKKSLMLSLPFLCVFYVALYFFENDVVVWTVVSLLALVFYRMLYWVPFHTDLASLTENKNRGKQLAMLVAVSSLLGIVIPVVSGFLITEFGFQIVFIIVIILLLIAIIPLNFLPDVKENFSWSYKKTWQEFFAKSNRKMMVTYMADGAENWIGGVLWPIFIWQLLEGKYLEMGALTSVITLIAVILKLFIGDYADKFNKRKLMNFGSVLYSIGWIAKMFISTAFHFFMASTYHAFALVLLRTPFDALVYEKAADSGHYLDEYSALREMYLQFGRAVVMVMILILLNFLNLNLVFFLAAIASLLVNLLPKKGFYVKAFN